MPQPQDVFRLVALRGPDTTRTTDPIRQGVKANARLVELGKRLRNSRDGRVTDEIMRLSPPLTTRALRSTCGGSTSPKNTPPIHQ